MHYEYRFNKVLLEIGWNILVDASLHEEISYCHLPHKWDDAQCVDLKKMKIRTGPYILIEDEFLGVQEEHSSFDYLDEIQSQVCHRYDITNEEGESVEPIPVKMFSTYMYDLIMYCMDMRINGGDDF